jgi:hypothetical protein
MLDSNGSAVFELAGPDFDWGDVIGPILDYYKLETSFTQCLSTSQVPSILQQRHFLERWPRSEQTAVDLR